jgi:hypothetical protein
MIPASRGPAIAPCPAAQNVVAGAGARPEESVWAASIRKKRLHLRR